MQLLDRVRRTIQAHDLARSDTSVVIALSGGSDSVALAHLLHTLDAAGELRIVGLVHFNHQLRAAAADDERFCRDVAAGLERPLLVEREDVAARARSERRSLEDAARTARYAFFDRARQHFSAEVVALGHTRDDQAETFLLRLLRGAGARGLAGMHPRNGPIVRPLLGCRRAELRAYLDGEHIRYVHDESNEDVAIPRNRVRAELLPVLQKFNPSIVDVLADEAEIARDEWRWMEAAADELSSGICRSEGDAVRIDVGALNALPVALARIVVRRAMNQMSGGRPVTFAHVEQALELSRRSGPPIDLPGQRLQRVGTEVVLTGRKAGTANGFRYPLSIPGEVELPEAGCIVTAETAFSAAAAGPSAVLSNEMVAVLRLDRCRGPLIIRNRLPGDWFRPLGLGGRKKLQDFFVDRKVARQQRDGVPLVVDQSDRIVWVAGHCIDDEFRVTDPAQAVLILRLRRVCRSPGSGWPVPVDG